MGITFENLGSEARIQYVNPTYLGYLHEGDVFDIAFTNRTFKLTVRADMDGDVISPNYGVVHDGRKTEHRQNSEGIDYPPYINVKVAFKDYGITNDTVWQKDIGGFYVTKAVFHRMRIEAEDVEKYLKEANDSNSARRYELAKLIGEAQATLKAAQEELKNLS